MERNRNMRVLVALIASVAIVTVWMVWHSVALAQSGLEISKVVDHTEVSPGGVVTYTITVTNTSGEPLSNVVITDELSSALEFVAASPEPSMEGQLLTWRIDSLPVSPTHEITLSARVGQGASGVIMNTAHVSAEGVPPRFDEAEIHIRAQEPSPTSTPISSTQITEQPADLHVRVARVSPLPIQPGGKIAIVIEYHNAGPGAAENVSLQVGFDPPDAM
ncbi:MAG: DUF11 domain-containing protein, partial [Anaerolineae bacterium]|nr:DUF11 domain-containing protein [Anaerolineae bacterium]